MHDSQEAHLEQQQRLNTAGGALPPAIGKPCMTEIYLHFTMRVFTYRCAAAMCGRSASPSSLTIAEAVALREADQIRADRQGVACSETGKCVLYFMHVRAKNLR